MNILHQSIIINLHILCGNSVYWIFCSKPVILVLIRSWGLQLQGGIHHEFTGETYLEILKVVKKAVPELHVHAFSSVEVFQGAFTLGIRYVFAYFVVS